MLTETPVLAPCNKSAVRTQGTRRSSAEFSCGHCDAREPIPGPDLLDRDLPRRKALFAMTLGGKAGLHFFAKQSQSGQNFLVRDEAAAVELGEKAAEADIPLQLAQLLGDCTRRAD